MDHAQYTHKSAGLIGNGSKQRFGESGLACCHLLLLWQVVWLRPRLINMAEMRFNLDLLRYAFE